MHTKASIRSLTFQLNVVVSHWKKKVLVIFYVQLSLSMNFRVEKNSIKLKKREKPVIFSTRTKNRSSVKKFINNLCIYSDRQRRKHNAEILLKAQISRFGSHLISFLSVLMYFTNTS